MSGIKTLPDCCAICPYRVIDRDKGDRCSYGGEDLPLMDGRFTYEAEMHKIRVSRARWCPLKEALEDKEREEAKA